MCSLNIQALQIPTKVITEVVPPSHPEHAKFGIWYRCVECGAQTQPQDCPSVGRIDHPVIPQPAAHRNKVTAMLCCLIDTADTRIDVTSVGQRLLPWLYKSVKEIRFHLECHPC